MKKKIGIIGRAVQNVRDFIGNARKKKTEYALPSPIQPKYERHDREYCSYGKSKEPYELIKNKVAEWMESKGEISIPKAAIKKTKSFDYKLQHSKKKSQKQNWNHWKGRK